ncbi:MAG: hypothetical protein CMJ18_23865 [Phycisphaeraceae bacterium]|nr:hypothetical protein [Phycisphaeraceae bacterium]
MSLRTFHLVFILAAIMLADMFGAWGVYHGRPVLGVGSFLGGFALIAYAIWFMRKLARTKIA